MTERNNRPLKVQESTGSKVLAVSLLLRVFPGPVFSMSPLREPRSQQFPNGGALGFLFI